MNQHILRKTLESFASRQKHDFNAGIITKPLAEDRVYQEYELALFVNDFILHAANIEISCKLNYLDEGQLKYAVQELTTPFLVFEKTNSGWIPMILFQDKKGMLQADRILAQGTQTIEGQVIDFDLLKTEEEIASTDRTQKFVLVTGLAWRAMVSHFYQDGDDEPTPSPFKRLMRLLGNEKKDIGYIYVYAMVIGLISLSLPIGIQSIINLISSGQFFNSVVVLISLVIVGVMISGGLQIMQMTLVEILQRRIFAKASFELAYRIPRIKMESLSGFYPPELMNQFFEIVNIQKGLPKLLIDISAATLQIVFGLLLLSFYHPFFVIFSGFLVGMVYLIFHFTGNKGLETSLKESKYKYKIAQWFEELARTLSTFKLAGTTNLPLEKTDQYVNNYLNYRKKHFGILVVQYGNVLAFKTLITAGILILGTILVVDRQITLGQFVASELVIIIVVSALEKIILNIDVVYDLLTGVEKLGSLMDMPLERTKGFVDQLPKRPKGMEIGMKDLHFAYPNNNKEALNGLSLHIPSGSRFCISGYSESGKETLARLLGGIYTDYTGNFNVNGISFRDVEINHYRDLVSKNFDRSEIFDGTILENITLGKPGISYTDVSEILAKLYLMDDINRLPNGILTELVGTGNLLSNSVLEKIIIARCLVVKPALLIIAYPVFMLENTERNHIYSMLMDRNLPTTVGFITNDQDLMKACDLVFVLEKEHFWHLEVLKKYSHLYQGSDMLRISNNQIPQDWAKMEFQALRTMNTSKSGKVLARWLIGIMILGGLCMFLPWQQNIPGKGKLTALDPAHRPQQIHTAIAGRIVAWKIKEGEYVNKGDTILTLAEIKDDYFDPDLLVRLSEQLSAKENSIQATERQVEAIKKQMSALENGQRFTLQKARNKVLQNRMKVISDSTDYEAEKIQFNTAKLQYDRYKALYEKDGLISLTDLEKRNLKLQETMAKRTSSQNKFYVSKNELINSLIELSSVEAEYGDKLAKAGSELGAKQSYLADAQSEYSKIRNKISNVEVRVGNYALTAPQDGFVVRALKVGIGETVKENEPLVTIMPDVTTKAIELYVKAMDVPLISKGRKVRIQFDGWPVLQFSGWPNSSVGTFGGEVIVIDYVASANGEYRLLVIPDKTDEAWPEQLRLGSGANGWVMLNDVPVWFELWRQINGFPPTISKAEAESGTGSDAKK